MFKNYIKIAWRNLINHPTFSIINILGLAVGMAVTIMIGLWVDSELSYNDHFPKKSKIALVYQSQNFNDLIGTGPAIPRPLEAALKTGYMDNFKHIIMSSWTFDRYLANGDVSISKQGHFIQKEGPEMLSLKMIEGQRNGLKDIDAILLSESCAKILFGEESALNKLLKLNSEHDLKVVGIYKDIPENNEFSDVEFMVSWEQYVNTNGWIKNSLDSWGNNSFQMFVELEDNVTMASASAAIKDVKLEASEDLKPFNPQLFLHPMEDWHLKSNFENGIQTGGRIENVWLFGIIGSFVLLLACINFMNLSTARSEKRAKEVGIRKAIGSFRGQLINQFLSESFLVVILSFILAVAFVLLTIEPFNELASKKMNFPWTNPTFWFCSLAFVITTAVLSGSYPALYLSSFQPVKVLKGTFKAGRFSALPRKALVVMQFTVSVTLIIGTLIVFRQIQFSKNRPVGYDKEGLVQIPVMSSDFEGKYDFMRTQFLNSGAIDEMSSSSSPTTSVWSNRSGFIWDGKTEGFQEDLAWTSVSYEFAKSLNLKIVAGRDFSREMASDSNAALINETAVKYLGLKDPVGMFLRDDSDDPGPPFKIIGVIQDMIVQSPYEPVKQALYAFDGYDNAAYYNLRLNPTKSASDNIASIEAIFKAHFPHLPFQYDFVDEEYGKKFASEERIGNLAGIFTILAILISCLGLFGLASFMAEQRTKEIGIRKVLGASVANLWAMLSKDFVTLVIISLFISTPLAWYFMTDWLSSYTYKANFAWWIFAASGSGAIGITILTVSYQAIKAAMNDPVKSLKSE
jgi:putative ABC transport system permease protein